MGRAAPLLGATHFIHENPPNYKISKRNHTIYLKTFYLVLIHAYSIRLWFLFDRVNAYGVVPSQAPFGGFKMSGLGREG